MSEVILQRCVHQTTDFHWRQQTILACKCAINKRRRSCVKFQFYAPYFYFFVWGRKKNTSTKKGENKILQVKIWPVRWLWLGHSRYIIHKVDFIETDILTEHLGPLPCQEQQRKTSPACITKVTWSHCHCATVPRLLCTCSWRHMSQGNQSLPPKRHLSVDMREENNKGGDSTATKSLEQIFNLAKRLETNQEAALSDYISVDAVFWRP